MKIKVLILAAVLTLTCSANAFAAFAWIANVSGECIIPVTGTRPALNIKPSANVTLGYDTVAGSGISYSLGSFHSTGTRSFGSSSTDTNLYYFDNAAAGIANTINTATPVPDAPTTATTQIAWGAGWTASK
jgi:hypothetical protein